VFIAGFVIGAIAGLYAGFQLGGWRAVLRISQIAHRDLMTKAGLKRR